MADVTEKSEADILRALQSRYEKDGYTFVPNPTRDLVPSFLGDYTPDALAISDQRSVIIEIKARNRGTDRRLAKIAAVVEAQPNWTFRVYYAPSFTTPVFEVSSPAAIADAVNEVKALQRSGYFRPAFLMAWSALEAFARILHANETGSHRGMIPSEVIEWLSQSGNIESSTGKRLRDLVKKRNAVVHGDLSTVIEPYDLDVMLEALHALLAELDDGE